MMPDEVCLEGLVNTAKRISDLEYQRRVWVPHLGGQGDTWEETCNAFFDDWDANWFVDMRLDSQPLNERTKSALRQLRSLFEADANNRGDFADPADLVEDPHWQLVCAAAQIFLRAIEFDSAWPRLPASDKVFRPEAG
ncbi:MAG: hypothetical protein U1D55_00405 [Phycisphaerae bacterium]